MSIWKSFEKDYQKQSELLGRLMKEADAIVVGIGAGMSASDGFTYVGPRFEEAFPDFIKKYGFFDMLQASLFDFESWEEYWAFQSRFVVLNYLDQPVGQSYLDLKSILARKDYHIITTNADNAFDIAGYDMKKVFHIQGEYALWQCSQHCHQQTYRDDNAIRKMVAMQSDMKIPQNLVPKCPKCHAPFEINKRNEVKGMVEDDDFYKQKKRYQQFLDHHHSGKILYLEIGVGNTTPQFIKHPFWKKIAENPDSLMISLNHKSYRIPKTIKKQFLCLDQDIASLITETKRELECI